MSILRRLFKLARELRDKSGLGYAHCTQLIDAYPDKTIAELVLIAASRKSAGRQET